MGLSAAEAIERSGLLDGPDGGVDDRLREARFIDHHVHSVRRGHLTREQLVLGLSETDRQEAADAGGIDHQLGVALRRWCAPLLGLDRHAPADDWLAHRLALDNEEVAARLLPLAGLDGLYVDTGYRSTELLPVAELGRLAGAPAEPVVRLETLAEEVASSGVTAAGYADRFREALHGTLDSSIAFKSIVAYRCGLDIDLSPPEASEVTDRAGRWLAAIESGSSARLVDPVIIRYGLWCAVETGRPIQVHTGYGDPDLDLHRSDPLLLTGFLRMTEGRCAVLLLHTYPFHRHAGYLAQVFPHVYMDIGLAVNHSGAQSRQLIAEMLEVAPFRKVLYSSDAWGLPELHLLGSWLFRRGLSRVLGTWVDAGDWSVSDAHLAIDLVGSGNARRVYGTRSVPGT